MDRLKPQGLLKYGLLSTLLVLALQEVANFVQIGGLNSQIGCSLIRLQAYCFCFLFLQRNDLQMDVEKLKTSLEAVYEAYLKQKKDKES